MANSYTNGTAITYTSLVNLANDAWAFCTQVDISTADGHDVIVGGLVNTAGTNWAADDYVEMYLTAPDDPANPTTSIGGSIDAGINGTDTTHGIDTAFVKEGLIYAGQALAVGNAADTLSFQPVSLINVFGYIPGYFQVVIHPVSAAAGALAASGSAFKYHVMKYTTS